jgi:two-component system, LuxR family, sensor kinase FixL
MTFSLRIMAMQKSVRRLGGHAHAILRHRRLRGASLPWMFGITAIVGAAILFLASALSLGIMLNRLRIEMQMIERTQAVVLQTRSIEQDLEDAEGAARHYRASGDRSAPAMVRIEGRNAIRRLKSLMAMAPADAEALGAVSLRIESEIAALAAGRDSNGGSRALAAFRAGQTAIYDESRANTDRHILNFIAFALLMALIGPTLGLVGISVLQQERGRRLARQMQSELMHVQRLAVMGETAAMLVHEVSHPLAAAGNYLAALKRTAGQDNSAKVADYSERAAQQIHRAATILGRLRRFIEKRDSERVPVAPAVLVQDAVALIGPLDDDVILDAGFDPDLADVTIDRIQIQQVLVNLIRNAIDAMRGSDRRRLAITARHVEARWIEFALADTGSGLPPEIAAKLFRPFVTTKKDGMGVGLSICRSIIASHGGTIWAEPNPQGGTVFRFRLPAA